MMLEVTVRFARLRYHGLRDDGSVEWPPSPVRLLGALINGAYHVGSARERDAALHALKVIAHSAHPVIIAPPYRALNIPNTYTLTSWAPGEQSNTKTLAGVLDRSFFGMSSKGLASKPQGAVALAGDTVTYVIEASLDDESLEALNAAAWSVPYLGRSSDVAMLDVAQHDPEGSDSLELARAAVDASPRWLQESGETDAIGLPSNQKSLVYRPYPGGKLMRFLGKRPQRDRSAAHTILRSRGWTPATIGWFNTNYERTFSPDPAINTLPPLKPEGYVTSVLYAAGDWPDISEHSDNNDDDRFDVVVLQRALPNEKIPSFWPVFLNAVRVAAADMDHAVAEYLRAAELFPLTISQHLQSRGECVGIGIWWPGSEDEHKDELVGEAYDSILQACATAEETALPWDRPVSDSLSSLNARLWIGSSTRWRSTTPLLAFPDSRVLAFQVADWAYQQWNCEARVISASRVPQRSSQRTWHSQDSDGNAQWWIDIEFSRPVTGPIVWGAGLDRGFGVFQADSYYRKGEDK